MKELLAASGKTAALWIAMIVGTALSGAIIHIRLPAPAADGPMSTLSALVVVAALDALIVALLASRVAADRAAKAVTLFVVIFGVETGMSSLETMIFRHVLGLSPAVLVGIIAAGAIRALVACTAAALLWPKSANPPSVDAARRPLLIAVVALYVLLYFAAGMLIAWRSPAVRDFYGPGAGVDLPTLILAQVGRGVLWCGLALLLATKLRGRPMIVGVIVGCAFAILMAAPLIYPNAIMPWAVRRVHLIELGVSNFIFGMASILLLREGVRWLARRRQPGAAQTSIV